HGGCVRGLDVHAAPQFPVGLRPVPRPAPAGENGDGQLQLGVLNPLPLSLVERGMAPGTGWFIAKTGPSPQPLSQRERGFRAGRSGALALPNPESRIPNPDSRPSHALP